MKDYLIGRENLAELVDSLIAKKFPNQPSERFKELREKSIDLLDNKVIAEILGSLTKEQTEELDALLDNQEASEEDFQNFFAKSNIDLEQKITKAMEEFSEKFLGGTNE